MADPKFKEILADLGKKPDNLVKYMQDHRVMDALGVLLNVDLINAAGEIVMEVYVHKYYNQII